MSNAHAQALARVEQALDETPWCSACGAHTTVVDRGGDLWLACSSIVERRGGVLASLGRLLRTSNGS